MKNTKKPILTLTLCLTPLLSLGLSQDVHAARAACEDKTYVKCMTRVTSLAREVVRKKHPCSNTAKAAILAIKAKQSNYKTKAEELNQCVKASRKVKKLDKILEKL